MRSRPCPERNVVFRKSRHATDNRSAAVYAAEPPVQRVIGKFDIAREWDRVPIVPGNGANNDDSEPRA